jgi:hypothetical protein
MPAKAVERDEVSRCLERLRSPDRSPNPGSFFELAARDSDVQRSSENHAVGKQTELPVVRD